jgi:hypothetical protein
MQKKRAKGKGKKNDVVKKQKRVLPWYIYKKYCIQGGFDIVGQVIL